MTVDRKETSVTVGMMIGIKKDSLYTHYSEYANLLDKLFADQNALTIRYLSKIRTSFMLKFKSIDKEIRFNLLNIDRLPDYFNAEEVMQLQKWDVPVVQSNIGADQYLLHINKLIYEHIDNCKGLFYDWIKFEYIKGLFCIPKYQKPNVLKEEFEKFITNINCYPYNMYIYWKVPQQVGLMLVNDKKFLSILYDMNDDTSLKYELASLTTDATEATKENIYEFIDNSDKTYIVVDCENSDVYKLYATIKGLNQEEIKKIEKIILIDDPNTSTAWQWLYKFTRIPTELIEIKRVNNLKSLVDIKLSVEITKYHYVNGIDSFLLCSSDSDYWGLISSIPTARFMVMYEKEKVGNAILEKLLENNINSCSIDDFCTGNATDLKKKVLLGKLEEYISDNRLIGSNAKDLVWQIYKDTKIYATEADVDNFCTKYIKGLKIKIDGNGDIVVEIPEV